MKGTTPQTTAFVIIDLIYTGMYFELFHEEFFHLLIFHESQGCLLQPVQNYEWHLESSYHGL